MRRLVFTFRGAMVKLHWVKKTGPFFIYFMQKEWTNRFTDRQTDMHGGEFTKMIRTDVETSIWHECDGLYMRCSEWHADTKKTCRERQTVKQRRVILHRKEQVNRRLTLANTVRFLPRGADYAVARCLYASVCLSVRPSVT